MVEFYFQIDNRRKHLPAVLEEDSGGDGDGNGSKRSFSSFSSSSSELMIMVSSLSLSLFTSTLRRLMMDLIWTWSVDDRSDDGTEGGKRCRITGRMLHSELLLLVGWL